MTAVRVFPRSGGGRSAGVSRVAGDAGADGLGRFRLLAREGQALGLVDLPRDRDVDRVLGALAELENLFRQRVLDVALDRAPQRTRAVVRVEALLDQEEDRLVVERERQA